MNTTIRSKIKSSNITKKFSECVAINENTLKIPQSFDLKLLQPFLCESAETIEKIDKKNVFKTELSDTNEKKLLCVDKYLRENNYGRLAKKDNLVYLVCFSSRLLGRKSALVLKNNIMCHIEEILSYLGEEELFSWKAVDKRKIEALTEIKFENGLLLSGVCRSKLFKKLDIGLAKFIKMFEATKYLSEKDIIFHGFFEKLADVLVAKESMIELSGATDVFDTKKTLRRLYESLADGDVRTFVKQCVKACEKAFRESFSNTIFRKRLEKEVEFYSKVFEPNTLSIEQCINLFAKNKDEEELLLINRIKKICEKTKFLGKEEAVPAEILEIAECACLKRRIGLFINLIDSKTLRDFSEKTGKLIKQAGENIVSSYLNENED